MRADPIRREIRRVLLITLTLNLIVATGKIILGLLTGALTILADGFHSLSDGAGSVAGLIANHFAGQQPDDDHPYGHRRFETMAALLIGGLLLLTTLEVGRGIIERLQNPEIPRITLPVFGVLLVTLAVNIFITRYQRRHGERLRSEVLLADSQHTGADVLVTSSVILSMGLMALTGWWWVDVVASLAVMLFIGRAAVGILRQTGRVLVDTAPYSSGQLEALIADVPSVTRVVRARSRGSVDAAHIDIDVLVAPEITAGHTAAIAQAIRDRLNTHLDDISEIEVHFVPVANGGRDYPLAVRAAADGLGLATHEVHVIDTPERKVLEMHVEVSPGQTLDEAHSAVTRLEQVIRADMPEITEVVTHIEPEQHSERGQRLRCNYGQEISTRALELLRSHYPHIGWHNLHVYDQDGGLTLTIHAAFAAEVTVELAHEVAEQAEVLLRTNLTQLSRITIHTEPQP
jgi:cation diffusion facilitator family transporter